MNIKKTIADVFQAEMMALQTASEVDFSLIEKAINIIDECKGKLVVTGVGKSAIVARKMVATLNSLGIASSYLHTADALHGDIGIINEKDCVMIISKSGVSEDLKTFLNVLSGSCVPTIGLVGNSNNLITHNCDLVIVVNVAKEADADNIIPTASIIAHMAICDAICIGLKHKIGISSQDFAKMHPAGALGKKLNTTLINLCSPDKKPHVALDSRLGEIVYEITSNRVGATAVLNNGEVSGIITDGDIRRLIQDNREDLQQLHAQQIMSKDPFVLDGSILATAALKKLNEKGISQVIVTNLGTYQGIVHIHDLIQIGISN